MILRLLLFIALCTLPYTVRASTSGEGCYIAAKHRIYTKKKSRSSSVYRDSPSIRITDEVCLQYGSGTPCRVEVDDDDDDDHHYGGHDDGHDGDDDDDDDDDYYYGIAGNWDAIYCPIDDYVWLLLSGTSALIFFISRKNIGQ